MVAQDLQDLNKNVRLMIEKFITDKKMSLAQFSEQAGVHQSQLWMYLHSGDDKKGLHTGTIQKLGKYMSENK